MNNHKRELKRKLVVSIILPIVLFFAFGLVAVVDTYAQGEEAPKRVMSTEEAEVAKFGLIAAAVAFGFGAIGAGIAIANVGAAAMGAIGEKPEIAPQALIFIALAEGLVVFGFITALMILGKV